MFTFPTIPTRPTTITHTETYRLDSSGAVSIGSGETVFGYSVPAPVSPPLWNTYNPLFGIPLVYAGNWPSFDTHLTNDGTIWHHSDDSGTNLPIGLWADEFTNNGLIVSEIDLSSPLFAIATAVWFNGAAFAGDVYNNGDIFALATNANAIGLRTQSSNATVHNSGLIAVQASSVNGRQGTAVGIQSDNDVYVVNEASGEIIVEGRNAAVGIVIERSTFPDSNTIVDNAGLIDVFSSHRISIGIQITGLSFENGRIENSGLIRADYTIVEVDFDGSITIPSQQIINHATGVLEGDVFLQQGADEVHNDGTINGNVFLGGHNDLFDNRNGTLNGEAHLGHGADRFQGSEEGEIVGGGVGDDRIDGGGGHDLIFGGANDDQLFGDAGNDRIFGESGDDIVHTEDGDIVDMGIGDDFILSQDLSFRKIDGGAGFDSWEISATDIVLDLNMVADTGRVTGIDAILLKAEQGLVIDIGAVSSITDNDTLYVVGSSSQTVYIDTNWINEGVFQLEGIDYTKYTNGGESVWLQTALTISNDSSGITVSGLDDIANGATAPGATSTSVVGLSGNIFTVDQYNVALGKEVNKLIGSVHKSSLTVDAGTIWQSLDSDFTLGWWNAEVSLINHGSIHAFGVNQSTFAVFAQYGKRIENFGEIEAFATGIFSADALYQGAFAKVITHEGSIIRAQAEFGRARAFFDGNIGTTNNGLIEAISEHGDAIAYVNYSGGNFANNHVVYASGGSSAIAIDGSNGGVSLNNYSEIRSISDSGNSIGIHTVTDAVFFRNYGTIEADTAILINDINNSDEKIVNEGTIVGDILFETRSSDYGLFSTITIINSGTLIGDINLHIADGRVSHSITNTGILAGNLILGEQRDNFFGTDGQFDGTISGGLGNDQLYTGDGDAVIYGGDGNDDIQAGDGNDILWGNAGADLLDGGSGDDILYVDHLDTLIVGAAGYDRLVAETGSGALNIDLTTSSIEHATGSEFADTFSAAGSLQSVKLYGGNGDDMLTGGGQADQLYGQNDNDTIFAGGGNDLVYGGDGDDLMEGQNGDDSLYGGLGNDRLIGKNGDDVLIAAAGDDILNGGAGNDSFNGGSGRDILYIDHLDSVINGGNGFDRVIVTAGSQAITMDLGVTSIEQIWGSDFGDTLDGSSSASFIKVFGGDGNDTFIGSDFGDRLYGEAGDDMMTGGLGNDRFFFETGYGNDTITDFGAEGRDRIDFKAAGITDISQLTISQVGADTLVEYGADSILLQGVDMATVNQFDFVFAQVVSDADVWDMF